ncbi:hypothetical protein [Demequina sediminicola]|uniref:hypothetical protein n=1 Tax=Demequina sediminicola TaxID=1095026 RepID=UPI0007849B24|nr:hypothetical protein [Demequina sediminicola]
MTDDITDLNLPGARGRVQVKGARGVFYTILVDDEVITRKKGAWRIPMKDGSTGELRSTGMIPGFQKLGWQGEEVFQFGAHASLTERIVMFAPLLLVFSLSLIGLVLGLVLFFVSVLVVKNEAIPRALRIALPLVNTVAGAVIISVLTLAVS